MKYYQVRLTGSIAWEHWHFRLLE